MTSSTTSRAACYLLHSILANNLVKYEEVAADINALILSPDTSGPAILADSSLDLMMHILHLRNTELPGGSLAASSSVVRWLCSKWNPSKTICFVREYLS